MSIYKRIIDNIETVSNIILEKEKMLVADKGNKALKLDIATLKIHLAELQKELNKYNLQREKEVIEIRLFGNSANYGTLPLEFIGGLTNNFAGAVLNTSHYVNFGAKGGKRRENIIRNTVDLRLEGIGTGSTIFYVSGKTSPDIYGHSIIQTALEKIFNFINSETLDQVAEKISEVGIKSIKYFSAFLNELNKDNLEVDLTWQTPENRKFTWNGDRQKINILFNYLNQIQFSEPEIIEFSGNLYLISFKGKIEILLQSGPLIQASFPNQLLSTMQEFHIGDFCSGRIEKTEIYNPVTEKTKIEYNLVEIKGL